MSLSCPSVRNSLDSILQQLLAEIDQQPESAAGQFEVRQQLLAVNWREFLDGLQFDNEAAVDDQVGAEAHLEADSLELDRTGVSRST